MLSWSFGSKTKRFLKPFSIYTRAFKTYGMNNCAFFSTTKTHFKNIKPQYEKPKDGKKPPLTPGYDYVVEDQLVEDAIDYSKVLLSLFEESYYNNRERDTSVDVRTFVEQNKRLEEGTMTMDDVYREDKERHEKWLEKKKEIQAKIPPFVPTTKIEQYFYDLYMQNDRESRILQKEQFHYLCAWLFRETSEKRKIFLKWLISIGRRDEEKRFQTAFVRSRIERITLYEERKKEIDRQRMFNMAESVYPPGPTGYYKDPVTTQIYVHGMGKKDKTEAKEAILQHAPQKAEGIAYDVQEILDSMKPLVAFDMGLDNLPEKRYKGNLGVYNDYKLQDESLIDPNDELYLGIEKVFGVRDIWADKQNENFMLEDFFPHNTDRIDNAINKLRKLASGQFNREGGLDDFIPTDTQPFSSEYPDPTVKMNKTYLEWLGEAYFEGPDDPDKDYQDVEFGDDYDEEFIENLKERSKLGYLYEPLQETLLASRRTQTTLTGGRLESHNCLVMLGSENGFCGVGFGEGTSPQSAYEKAKKNAFKNLRCLELPREGIKKILYGKYRKSKVIIYPSTRPGIIGHPVLAQMAHYLRMHDIAIQTHGSRNLITVIGAFMSAIDQIKSTEEQAYSRGRYPLYCGTRYADYLDRVRLNRGIFGWN